MAAFLIGLEFSVQFDRCDPSPDRQPPGIPEELAVADDAILCADIQRENPAGRRYYYSIVRLSAQDADQAEVDAQSKFVHLGGYLCHRCIVMADPDPTVAITPEILGNLRGSLGSMPKPAPAEAVESPPPAPEATAKPVWQLRYLIETTADPGALRTRLIEYVDQAIVQLQPGRRLLVTIYFQAETGEEAKELAGQLLQQECEKLGADEPLYNEIEAVLVR